MGSDNEGTEFKETKQKKKGSETSQQRGQKEEENTVKEIIPDELWGDTGTSLPGRSCNVKKLSNSLAVLTRHSGSRSGKRWGQTRKQLRPKPQPQIRSPQIHRSSWETAATLPGLRKGRLSSHFRGANRGNKNLPLKVPLLVKKEPKIISCSVLMWSLRETGSFLLLPKGKYCTWRKEHERNPCTWRGLLHAQKSPCSGDFGFGLLAVDNEAAHPPPLPALTTEIWAGRWQFFSLIKKIE